MRGRGVEEQSCCHFHLVILANARNQATLSFTSPLRSPAALTLDVSMCTSRGHGRRCRGTVIL